jgi:hypothetical protein
MKSGRSARSVRAACALTAALTLAGAATATPASAATGPNLKITVTVQEGRWLQGDAIPVDVTVANIGDTAAEHVTGSAGRESGAYFAISDGWGDLQSADGASFAPGESRTYHLHGSVYTLDEGDPVVDFSAYVDNEADYSDNATLATVPLLPKSTTDRVAGHLYGDRDRDGKPSPGEDIAGAEAHLIGTGMSQDLIVTTDAAGRFAFDGVPITPSASVHFEKVPDGWVVPYLPSLRLDGSGEHAALEVKATRPLTDVLTETITLDKTSYAVGETGMATVTLQNTGDRPLTGLYAGCDPGGFGRELVIPHEQWGAFDPWHPAGALAPGERLVLKVSGKVPEAASYFGRTGLGCYVDGEQYGSGPYTFAGARVPGKKADAKGQVWIDKNRNGRPDAGEGLSKTKVVLTSDGTHPVALTQTDANGFATFRQVDVGEYGFRALGPWATVGDGTVYVVASPYGYGDWSFQVTPR